jgi:membrane-bound lysozyme inhibitor of c-type lysozyme MliC
MRSLLLAAGVWTAIAMASSATEATSGRTRAYYICDNNETLRVTFDHSARTATLARYARRNVHLAETDATRGFRYAGESVVMEGDGAHLLLTFNGNDRLVCRER